MLNELLNFLIGSTLFTSSIAVVNFTLCWFFYDKVCTRGISLKNALFKDDNLACWMEFIGALVFPVFYLSALGIQGSVGSTIWVDWGISLGYAVAYAICFLVLRLLSDKIIKGINITEKIDLNTEIFKQNNIAAAIFSATLSLMFINIIRFLDYFELTTSLLKMSVVIIICILAFILYKVTLNRKTTIFKEVFIDNNAAASISFLGFVYAITYITQNAIVLQGDFNYLELLLMIFVLVIAFYIISLLFKLIFVKILKVDMFNEVYEQNNAGAAIGEGALYIGIALSIIHFIK